MRFCAFAAKNGKLALEKPFPDGRVHGVFTFALMQGLNGKGCDDSGAITTESLSEYLWRTVPSLLTAEDGKNPQIASRPDVSGSDRFNLVPAAAPLKFPVQISAKIPGQRGLITDGRMQTVAEITATPPQWNLALARGLYKVAISGSGNALFEVTGEANPDHSVSVVNVNA